MSDHGVPREKLLELARPFPQSALDWRLTRAGKSAKGIWAFCVPYLKSHAVQDRFDEAVGPDRWQVAVKGTEKHLLVGIGVLTEHGWVWKWDGSGHLEERGDTFSAADAGKGDITNAAKRAAQAWGVGRFLRQIPEQFAQVYDANSDGGRYYASQNTKQGVITFRWDPPREWVSAEAVQKAAATPTTGTPDAPRPHEDPVAIVEQLQAEVRGFMRQNNLRSYHLEAVIQVDKQLPDQLKDFGIVDWQRLAEICRKQKLLWDEAPRILAKEFPTAPERLDLLTDLAIRVGVAPKHKPLIATAKSDGWSDAVEYWINELLEAERSLA